MKCDVVVASCVGKKAEHDRIFYLIKLLIKQMYKILNGLSSSSLAALFVHERNIIEYDLRGSSTSLQLHLPKTENLKKSFCYDGAKL